MAEEVAVTVNLTNQKVQFAAESLRESPGAVAAAWPSDGIWRAAGPGKVFLGGQFLKNGPPPMPAKARSGGPSAIRRQQQIGQIVPQVPHPQWQ